MKKTLLMISAVMFITLAQAQSKKNVIKLNILAPIVKTFNVSYERALSPNSSFQLGFFYTGFSGSGTTFKGIGITPEYRFYLSETEAPHGVYVAPFVRYQSFDISDTDFPNEKATFSAFGGGVVIGKQWLFKEKIALDIFLGPAYYSGSTKVSSGSTATYNTGSFDGFGLRAGINFGFAF